MVLGLIKKHWQSLKELLRLYKEYRIYKVYKPYTIYGIRNSVRLLKMYLNKEDIA